MAELKMPSRAAEKRAREVVMKWQHTMLRSYRSAILRDIALALDEVKVKESRACEKMMGTCPWAAKKIRERRNKWQKKRIP